MVPLGSYRWRPGCKPQFEMCQCDWTRMWHGRFVSRPGFRGLYGFCPFCLISCTLCFRMGAWWLSCLTPPHCGSIWVSGFAPCVFVSRSLLLNVRLILEIGVFLIGQCRMKSGYACWCMGWSWSLRRGSAGVRNRCECVTDLGFRCWGFKSYFCISAIVATGGLLCRWLKRNLKVPWYLAPHCEVASKAGSL